jgi:hypothetical protein
VDRLLPDTAEDSIDYDTFMRLFSVVREYGITEEQFAEAVDNVTHI